MFFMLLLLLQRLEKATRQYVIMFSPAPAWLVYGHSFAVENKNNQTMAATLVQNTS